LLLKFYIVPVHLILAIPKNTTTGGGTSCPKDRDYGAQATTRCHSTWNSYQRRSDRSAYSRNPQFSRHRFTSNL